MPNSFIFLKYPSTNHCLTMIITWTTSKPWKLANSKRGIEPSTMHCIHHACSNCTTLLLEFSVNLIRYACMPEWSSSRTWKLCLQSRVKNWSSVPRQLSAVKLPLCAGCEEGPHYKGLTKWTWFLQMITLLTSNFSNTHGRSCQWLIWDALWQTFPLQYRSITLWAVIPLATVRVESIYRHATINTYYLPSDVRRCRQTKESHKRWNLGWFSQAPKWSTIIYFL